MSIKGKKYGKRPQIGMTSQAQDLWENYILPSETNGNEFVNLGTAIVEQTIIDFDESWRTHDYKSYRECLNFLNSDKVSLFSNGKYNRKALLEHLVKRCQRLYGDFVKQ
jgi:hypothetical protein